MVPPPSISHWGDFPSLFVKTGSERKSLQNKRIHWIATRSSDLVSLMEDFLSITVVGQTKNVGISFIFTVDDNSKQDK